MPTRQSRRMARWAVAATLAFAAYADAVSMKDTIDQINAGTIPADYKLTKFAEFASKSSAVSSALTGATNSITMFAFTDETWNNVFNNTEYPFRTYFGYEPNSDAIQGGIALNHMIQKNVNLSQSSGDDFILNTYLTALKSSDPSGLVSTDTGIITALPPFEVIGLNFGLGYAEIIESKSTDQGPLHVLNTILVPYPNADQSMRYTSEITGGGNSYNFTSFYNAMVKAGISTDQYSKVTVLGIDDITWDAFEESYGTLLTDDQRRQILQFHIIPDNTVYLHTEDARFPQTLKTLQGDDLELSSTDGTLFIGSPGAVNAEEAQPGSYAAFGSDGTDRGVKNGVIQALNEVLVPSGIRSALPTPTFEPGPTETLTITETFTFSDEVTPTMDPAVSTIRSTRPSSAGKTVGGLLAVVGAVLSALLLV